MFNLQHLQIDSARSRYPIPEIAPGAYLEMRSAHETVNAELQVAKTSALEAKRETSDLIAKGGRGQLSRETLDEIREIDRRLFPHHVVVGWSGVRDKDGNLVEYSTKACEILFRQLPAWLLDRIRVFAIRPENFTGTAMEPEKVAAVAGNSSGA